MPSNVDSSDLILRRFLVLEDDDGDFETECDFLRRICDLCVMAPDDTRRVENIEIIRLDRFAPRSHRRPAWVGNGDHERQTSKFLTAPLAVTRSDAKFYRIVRDGEGWRTDLPCELPHDPMLVVPWRLREHSGADYFMPHAVLLDIVTYGSDTAFLSTKSMLQGACYPSDLVWILSRGAGTTEPYGLFFPKFETLGEVRSGEARNHVLRRLGNIFSSHARRHHGYKKDEQGVSSYLGEKAQEFYQEFVIPESWRSRVQLTGNHLKSENREALCRIWSRVAGDDRGAPDKTFSWVVTEKPTKDKGLFSFFTGELEGEDQWLYASGRTFGLPFRRLWDTGPEVPKPAEDVIVEAARQYVDRQTSFVFRRNLAVFLYMVLGSMDNFNGLNSAIPSLDLSQGTFHAIVNEVLGEELAAAQLEVRKRRRNSGRGRPFVDWLNSQFWGTT